MRAHPQAQFGIDLYTHDGEPVLCRAVPHLPAQEFVGTIFLVKPEDVGFLQRLIKAFKCDTESQWSLAAHLTSDSAGLDVQLMAGSAVVSSIASTLLRSWNIVGIDESALLQGMANDSLNALVASKVFVALIDNEVHRADFFSSLRAALAKLTATDLPTYAFADRNWCNLGHHQEPAHVALPPRHLFMDIPPHHGNALAVDVVLAVRPAEWGISAPSPTADLSAEAVAQGYGPNSIGVFTHTQVQRFTEAAGGKKPYIYIPSATIIIQTALQIAGGAAAALGEIADWEAHVAVQPGTVELQPAYRKIPAPSALMAGTALLMPNAVRTYRHRDMHVCAPALVVPAIPIQVVMLAKGHHGPVLYGGLSMQRVSAHRQQAPLMIFEKFDRRNLQHRAKKASQAQKKAGETKDKPKVQGPSS